MTPGERKVHVDYLAAARESLRKLQILREEAEGMRAEKALLERIDRNIDLTRERIAAVARLLEGQPRG